MKRGKDVSSKLCVDEICCNWLSYMQLGGRIKERDKERSGEGYRGGD